MLDVTPPSYKNPDHITHARARIYVYICIVMYVLLLVMRIQLSDGSFAAQTMPKSIPTSCIGIGIVIVSTKVNDDHIIIGLIPCQYVLRKPKLYSKLLISTEMTCARSFTDVIRLLCLIRANFKPFIVIRLIKDLLK